MVFLAVSIFAFSEETSTAVFLMTIDYGGG
jgi:hypothetical protein